MNDLTFKIRKISSGWFDVSFILNWMTFPMEELWMLKQAAYMEQNIEFE